MEISTRFNISDLTAHKYEHQTSRRKSVLEIMEVITTSCYAGTQVFYLCRLIILEKKIQLSNLDKKEWSIYHSIGKDVNDTGWKKYREDELIPLSQEITQLLKNIPEEEEEEENNE